MNSTLATVSVVVIQYNDTTLTTSNTIYPQYLPEGNQYLSPRPALITTVKTTIPGTGRYTPPTPEPTSLDQVTTLPRTAGAPAPRQTLSTAQDLGFSPPTGSPDLFGTPTDSSKLVNNPDVVSTNFPGAAKNSPSFLGDQAIARPSVTASQGAYNPVKTVPVVTVHGSTYQADEASHFVIDGQTITPGGVITAYGTPIAVDSDASIAVIGSSTQSLSRTIVTPKPLLTFAGTTYTADDTNNFVIAGETLTRGGSLEVDGTRLSLDQAGTGIVIGTSASLLISPGVNTAAAAAAPALTFGGSTYTAGPSSDFVLAGQTLTKGGIITFDGTQISYNEAGSNVVIGTSTYPLAFPGTTAVTKPVLTFDGSTYTLDSLSDFALDGQTLAKGGSITVHGTQLSYDEAGTAVVVGSSTQLLSLATITAAAEPILTFDGSTYVADSSTNFLIDGQILSKGDMITVDGTQLSYDQAGTDVVIGSSTQILGTTSIAAAEEPAITFDGSTYLADSASDFIIDGQTLTRGGVITVEGTPVSYAAGGTDVVVGTSTEAVGLKGGVISGFGVSSSTSGVAVQFTGEAPGQYSASWAVRFIFSVLAAILLL